MNLGLIGNPLGHSWSPEIHRFLIGADYKIWELQPDCLDEFFRKREFDGINVTIPYKQEVIKYLDEIDENAERIGAVNTIVNRDGKLKGYNTDYLGLMRMIKTHSFDIEDREVAILGTGGASKAAVEAVRELKGSPVLVSRSPRGEIISYDELYTRNFEYIINTTPVGLYPNENEMPIDLEKLPNLRGLIDIIANPVRTSLVFEASQSGVPAFGGLEMLVSQALEADMLFTGLELDNQLIEKCMRELLKTKRNIVLIGMPSSGKSTIANELAEMLGRELIEMDQEIVDEVGMPIANYFKLHGEDAFRDKESDVSFRAGQASGKIISTGGGIIKRKENMRNLAHNGLIIWIDRNVELLIPTDSRPLSNSVSDLYKLYEQRKGLYKRYCDVRVMNDGTIDDVINTILKII